MRLLAATAVVLLLGVANAKLDLNQVEPKFILNKCHVYTFYVNMTSKVLGLSSQSSKAVVQGVAKVYAASEHENYLMIQDVKVSESTISVGSSQGPVELKKNPALEAHLAVPIKFMLDKGKVTSYSLDSKESIESKKIKRVLLRIFETETKPSGLGHQGGHHTWPITYNITKFSPVGNYSSHIILTSSPYPDFPKDLNVMNITRTDNFETIPYLTYHSHHNYEKQGCPEVCKKNHVENRFGAGCPVGYEPYQTPMKKSFVQHHNLKKVFNGIWIYDIVETKENHVADIYDQEMLVSIDSYLRFKNITSERIPEPTDQHTYTDLNDWRTEVNEQEIARKCKYPTVQEAIAAVKKSLTDISKVIYMDNIDSDEAKNIGEKLVLLQKGMALLRRKDLEDIQRHDIVSYDSLPSASEEDKIKRQIWLDNLPLTGSSDSTSFIVDLIKTNINKINDPAISLFECKSMLEALPLNIWNPNSETIEKLSELLEVLQERTRPGYGMFYSAAHLAVARVINKMCSGTNGIPEADENNRPNYLQRLLHETDEDYNRRDCPKSQAKKYVRDVVEKLKSTRDRLKTIIYIESLSRTGLKAVIPVLKRYAYGHISHQTPSYADFTQAMTINTLHNLLSKYPKEIKDIALAIFSNTTEAPKIRNSAFGVFIKCSPTLGDLQHIAQMSWTESSQEVASFVTSTLETFGNSTIPCHQLLAMRIKKVLPQVKKCADGKHHAQNILKTAYDGIRDFGIENQFSFTPSNESFFPSILYASFGYNADSLQDVFFQYALNSQGFNSRNLWDNILRALGQKTAEDIPRNKESEIFPEIKMVDRDPEFWRFTLFQKQFYSTAFYYMDAVEFQTGDIISLWKQHMAHLFKIDSNSNISGHIVRVAMPSSYQTKTFAGALPYPVQFEMRNPIVLSLKIDIKRVDNPKGTKFEIGVNPSIYHSMLYTNQMLNLGDCKQVGVYHEKKMCASYPFKVTVQLNQTKEGTKFELGYTFPELPKKIFWYHSEAGTFARKHTLDVQPRASERKTIRTVPAPFLKKMNVGFPGMPPFSTIIRTEDISLTHEEVPRNNEEVLQQFIEDFLNPGWREKTYDVYRVEDEKMWNKNTKVSFYFTHEHSNVRSQIEPRSDDKWSDGIDFESHDAKKSENEDRIIRNRFSVLSHKHDKFSMIWEHKHNSRVANNFHLFVDHNCTYEGDLHSLFVQVNGTFYGVPAGAIGRLATYYSKPLNVFKYGHESYGKQKALAIGSLRFSGSPRPYAATKLVFSFKPLHQYLSKELASAVPAEYFLPETHKECLRDVSEGKALTTACKKAIRELAIYNKLNMNIAWEQDLPRAVKDIMEKLDLALKHAFYSHLSIEKKNSSHKSISLDLTYINRMTDEPVFDAVITKPTEKVKLLKVDADGFLPVSNVYSGFDSYIQEYTNNTYPATCSLMENYLGTYDLRLVPLPRQGSCSYVLTSHCTKHKKFACIVKMNADNKRSRIIYLYVGRNTIVLTPGTQSKYMIKYDGKEQPVAYQTPILLNPTQHIYAVTRKAADGSYFLEVHAERAGIKVTYTGQQVRVQVHPRYKGELCGLCSEFNGEYVKEWRAPNRCLYEDVYDFSAACAVGNCYKANLVRRSICDGDEYKVEATNDQDDDDDEPSKDEYVPTLKRNVVIRRDDQTCISKRPVPVCKPNDMPTQTKTEDLEYHCLPSSDHNARKLSVESQRRILGELETKKSDRTEPTEYAVKCAADH